MNTLQQKRKKCYSKIISLTQFIKTIRFAVKCISSRGDISLGLDLCQLKKKQIQFFENNPSGQYNNYVFFSDFMECVIT